MPSGSNLDLDDVYRIYSLSAGAYGVELVPAMDVSAYKWLSLTLDASGVYSGVLTFQGSSDKTNWISITLYLLSSLMGGDSSSQTQGSGIMVGGPIRFPYFRVWMSSYTSGTATGSLELRKDGLAGFSLISQYAQLLTGRATIGFINNEGTASVAIPAGTSTDTVVWSSNAVLSRVLVTATGTNQMQIYDNNSVGSGTVVGIIPASSSVNGVPFVYMMPCSSGITVKGNANNPGVTISFANL